MTGSGAPETGASDKACNSPHPSGLLWVVNQTGQRANKGVMRAQPPPNLPAMSTTRAPQMPLLPTTIVSPGSSRFAMHASMPAARM